MPEQGSRLGTVIVLTRDVAASRAFHADLLGLPVVSDEFGMVTLDAGVPLLLHPAQAPQPSRESVNLQFSVDGVDAQIEWMRRAAVLDPDGHAVFLAQPL